VLNVYVDLTYTEDISHVVKCRKVGQLSLSLPLFSITVSSDHDVDDFINPELNSLGK